MDRFRLRNFWQQIRNLIAAMTSMELPIRDAIGLVLEGVTLLREMPDWSLSRDTQAWIVRVLQFAGTAADLTETELDDEVLEWIADQVRDDETWDAIYELIAVAFAGATPTSGKLERVADKTGMDPQVLVLLVHAVVRLISWWRAA